MLLFKLINVIIITIINYVATCLNYYHDFGCVTIEGVRIGYGFIDHLYTQLGTNCTDHWHVHRLVTTV
jgi:type VI protein secretion system component Hcp